MARYTDISIRNSYYTNKLENITLYIYIIYIYIIYIHISLLFHQVRYIMLEKNCNSSKQQIGKFIIDICDYDKTENGTHPRNSNGLLNILCTTTRRHVHIL